MKKAIVDLIGCENIFDLHQRFKEALDFPDYYGMNLDAFWDCISCDCDIDFVSIKGSKTICNELKPTMEKMLEILERNKGEWEDFDYEILS